METEWNVVSESMLNQLSNVDKSLVKNAVERAAMDWQHTDAKRIVGAWGNENVFVLRAGTKFRIVVSLHPGKITVLDVIPREQLEALRPVRRDAG